jgi:hypothetical protein
LPVETIPALTTAQFDFIDIPLIYRENLADLRAARPVDKTSPLFRQHRTGKKQVAACAALVTVTLTNRNLALGIPCSEMNQPETPQFAPGMKHKAGILKRLCDRKNQTIEKSG